MANLADLLVHVGVDADDLESGIDNAVSNVENNLGKIGLAGLAAGGGLEAFARGQAPLRESAAKIAAATGEEADAINDLAREASNVTFPLDEVYASMESGRQQGIESGEQLQEFATFWDTVGDATGEAGPELADAGIALRAVGIAAGEEKEALGAFGFMTEETTQGVGDFLKFLERTGPELNDMGADVDDAAAIMGVLESEMGMSARTARQEFRSAVNEADGDMGKMLETLGVSGETFEEYRGKVDESSGVIERNAEIHAESYTVMQKVQHGASELMNRYSGLFDMASSLALPLMALGPIMKGVTVAARGMGLAMTVATGPIGIIIAVIAALVAGLVIAYNKSETFREVVDTAFAAVKEAIGTAIEFARGVIAGFVGWATAFWAKWGDNITAFAERAWENVKRIVSGALDIIKGVWDVFAGVFSGDWERVWDGVKSVLSGAWDIIGGVVDQGLNFIKNLLPMFASVVRSAWGRLWDWVKDRLSSAWVDLKAGVSDGISNVLQWFRDLPGDILSALGDLGSLLLNAGKNVVDGLIDGIKSKFTALTDTAKKLAGKVRDFLPFSPAKEGPLSGKGSPDIAGAKLVEMVADGMGSQVDGLARMADEAARAALPDLATPGVPRVRGGEVAGGDGMGRGLGKQTTITVGEVRAHDYEDFRRQIDDEARRRNRTSYEVPA